MPHDAITVIIPTFNAGPLIEGCLDSVLRQTHRNLEVWVLDGGSTDETVSILARYAAQDPRVRWISEPDRGIYDAMNKGMRRAQSEWLYFLGSDDRLHDDDAFARVAAALREDRDLVYGNVFNVHRQAIVGELFTMDLLLAKTICHQGIFYRRTLLEQVGAYETAFKVCGDWDLNLRCFVAGARTHYVPTTICSYAGNGFSSVTVDRVFLACKLERISQLARRSLWSSMFQSRRFEFHDLALQARQAGQWARAAKFMALYGWHSVAHRIRPAQA